MPNEINDVKPTSIRHMVGQVGVVKQVGVALDAAFDDGRKFDQPCWSARPGWAKSALAAVIAEEMATDFHEVLGLSITSIGDLNALLLEAKDKDCIHIDEAHRSTGSFKPPSTWPWTSGHLRRQAVGAADSNCGLHAAAQHDRRILPACSRCGTA